MANAKAHGRAFKSITGQKASAQLVIPRRGSIKVHKRMDRQCTLKCIQFRDDAFDSFQIMTLFGYP